MKRTKVKPATLAQALDQRDKALKRADRAERDLYWAREAQQLAMRCEHSARRAMETLERQWRDMAARLEAAGLEPDKVIHQDQEKRDRAGILAHEKLEELRTQCLIATTKREDSVQVDLLMLIAMINALEGGE